MDRTYEYREFCRAKAELKGTSIQPHEPIQPDRFTTECLQIDLRKLLVKLRPFYLSSIKASSFNDVMTDEQRDEIDYQTRLNIQGQMGKLKALEALEEERVSRLSTKTGGLTKLFADPKVVGINKTVELHRAGILWFLNERLKHVSDLHASQQEVRFTRQVERAKSNLHAIKGTTDIERPSTTPNLKVPSRGYQKNPFESELSSSVDSLPASQIQELELENNKYLEEMDLKFEKVKAAEKSMIEISELQSAIAANLAMQNENIQSMLDDALDTSANVAAANKELSGARKRNRVTSKIIVYTSVTFALIILLYDAML